MTESSAPRTAIPTELRRQVLIQAGHRCAIPTCRQTEIDVHHIVPWEECGTHEPENLIALCPNCHRRAHRGEIDRKSLVIYRNSLASTLDHGVVRGGNIVLDRSKAALHLLEVAGNITFTTAGWLAPIDKLVLRLTNAGSYTTTWGGIKSLPFATGFFLQAKGVDMIELNRYGTEVHFNCVHSTPER